MENERPWLQYYPEGAKNWTPRYNDMLSVYRTAISSGQGCVRYFGTVLPWSEIDQLADRLAVWAIAQGVQRGDRISIILHNVPSFVIGAIAAWKIGAIPTPANPMYTAAELTRILRDCTPKLVICQAEQAHVVDEALAAAGLQSLVRTVSATDHATSPDPRVLPTIETPSARSLMRILDAASSKPVPIEVDPKEIGLLLYTSGTTGKPKGAMLRQESLASNAQHAADWCGVDPTAKILAMTPLFHIVGTVGSICMPLFARCELILHYRFEPSLVLDVIRRERPTYTVGPITAFNSLAHRPDAARADFASFRQVFSGGAPIAPALHKSLCEKMGVYIHNCYGMTETCATTISTPVGHHAPVDPLFGALSIGVPGFGTDAKIVDAGGRELRPGEAGELWIKGRQVMAGYWEAPEETAASLTDGWMRSGDVGFRDEAGWFYLIDRMKDVIVASGFKVWPREVEDALHVHPAVREAAVVGEPDTYRGETVIAYVALRPGNTVGPAELISHCRALLSGYKVPREIRVLNDLPKTLTGKIQRNLLRVGRPSTERAF